MDYYAIRVKTDSYAPNFDREMCAYMTGHVGECEIGGEFVDYSISKIFNNIKDFPRDDDGCYSPVSVSNSNHNDFLIFFDTKPTDTQIDIMTKRAMDFSEIRKTTPLFGHFYKDENIKILGFELIFFSKRETSVTELAI